MLLLGLLRRIDDPGDDRVGEDLPLVFAELGAASIPPLTDYLAGTMNGQWARLAAAHSFGKTGQRHPELCDECGDHLRAQLARFAGQTETLNAILISCLLDLRAVEVAPLIEQVHASNRVDEMVHGDWEDAQIELGLKAQREHPPKPNSLTELAAKLRGIVLAKEKLDALMDNDVFDSPPLPYVAPTKVGRNESCLCGSGK